MPLPRHVHLNQVGTIHKSDTMKDLKTKLEKAKSDLVAAQKANNAARMKKLQQTIIDLTGTIERNS